MHEEDYIDLFIMVDQTPVQLLNDYYQLTGNPVLLPKFGFMKVISMPITVTIGRKLPSPAKVRRLKMARTTWRVRKTTEVSRSR